MHRKILAVLALSGSMSTVHADVALQTWEFKYTGANEARTGWNPDWTMASTFTGRDFNSDGIIDLEELASFILRGRDFLSCEPSEYTRCGVSEFLLDHDGNLRFFASRTSSDPEGWYGSIEYYSTAHGEYLDYYTPVVNNVTDYRITVDTVVNVMQVSGPGMPPAVPEPAQSFMFVAGLALVGAFRWRAKKEMCRSNRRIGPRCWRGMPIEAGLG